MGPIPFDFRVDIFLTCRKLATLKRGAVFPHGGVSYLLLFWLRQAHLHLRFDFPPGRTIAAGGNSISESVRYA